MDETPITVSALKPFPDQKPADEGVQSTLTQLWQSHQRFIILSGPPGVGKTRAAEDYIAGLLEQHNATHDESECRLTQLFPDFRTKVYDETEVRSRLVEKGAKFVWDICVLHPQYTYEDLIRGYRVSTQKSDVMRLEVREGFLGFISRVASVLKMLHPDASFPLGVLILDEINRAPIGQLFGEAMYALDRRGEPASTPYELSGLGSTLVVPDSLMLLGTMNSVDRAISGFDFALRRRFTVVTMVSKKEPIEQRFISSPKVQQIALALYDRLKDAISSSVEKGVVPLPELVIGHSYFLPPQDISNEGELLTWLAQSYRFQILPTLVDYQEQGLLTFEDSTLSQLPASDVVKGKKSLGDVITESLRGELEALGPFPETTEDNAHIALLEGNA